MMREFVVISIHIGILTFIADFNCQTNQLNERMTSNLPVSQDLLQSSYVAEIASVEVKSCYGLKSFDS